MSQELTVDQLEFLLASKSLWHFVRAAWHVVEPNTTFIDNWHVGCICEHLEALTALELRKLIINIPPRHAKSLLVSVFWFCWVWLRDPGSRWMYSSYGEDLAGRDSLRSRDIIQSPWYQQRWANRFRLKTDQNVKTRFANDRQGWRIATTVDGKATGEGGDYIVTDDPHKVQEARSKAKRQAVIDWWTQGMSTRGNDPQTVRHVVVMQRLNERDLTGYLLAEKLGYEHLCLPCEFEPRRIISLPSAAAPKDAIVPTKLQRERPHLADPRKAEGELLWPQRFGPKDVSDLKASLQAYGTAGQLQQRPSPADGQVYRRELFRYFSVEMYRGQPHVVLGTREAGQPEPARIPVSRLRFFQTIDTATSLKETAAFTAVGTWAVTPHKHLLAWSMFRERLEVPEQFETLMKLREGPLAAIREGGVLRLVPLGAWPKPLMFQAVESQSSGIGLLQQGAADGCPFRVLKADADKVTRAAPVATMYYNGMVWHRTGAEWLTDYEDELLSFPSGAFADQADITAYAGILVVHEKILTAHAEGELAYNAPDEQPQGGLRDFPFNPSVEEMAERMEELDPDLMKQAREELARYL